MAKRQSREMLSVRLPSDMARWLRREAALRHTTVTAIVEEAVQKAVEGEKTEAFARAALKAICRAVTKDEEKAREFEKRMLAEALVDMRMSGNDG